MKVSPHDCHSDSAPRRFFRSTDTDRRFRTIGNPDVLRNSLRHTWLIFGISLIAGCSGYPGPRSVANEDPAIKIPQIKQAVDANDRSAIPQLLDDLDSDDAAVRFYAAEGLRRMSGKTFDYDWTASDRHARRPAIERWRAHFAAASDSR